MSNMQPQLRALNTGPWKSLETYERNHADKKESDVYVVAGPLFSMNAQSIGADVVVPKAAYRITVVLPRGASLADVTASTAVYAVEMPNDPRVKGRTWSELRITVDAIERDTGYDFLDALPDEVERAIEARDPRLTSDARLSKPNANTALALQQ